MKIINAFIESTFQKDHAGKEIFFPWGILGKGYEIKDLYDKEKVFKFYKLYILISFIIFIIWALAIQTYLLSNDLYFGNLLVAFGIILGLTLWWYVVIKKYVRSLPVSSMKYSYNMGLRKRIKAIPFWFLWLGFFISMMIFYFSLDLFIKRGFDILVLIASSLFGVVAIVYAYFLLVRYRS